MKNVLVTGGTGGIGKSLVQAFLSRGDRVAFCYHSSCETADKMISETSAANRLFAFRGDLAEPAEQYVLCEEVLSRFGEVDILINNAGTSLWGPFQDVTREEFDRVMNTNFAAAYFLSRAFAPGMIRRRWGRILNVSSVWGQTGASCEVLYSATKAALIGFTKALAKELAPSGVRVNAIAPGVVDTEMMARFTPAEREEIKQEIPMERFARPEEIAALAVFLSGDDADYLTGQVIAPNGGMYC